MPAIGIIPELCEKVPEACEKVPEVCEKVTEVYEKLTLFAFWKMYKKCAKKNSFTHTLQA